MAAAKVYRRNPKPPNTALDGNGKVLDCTLLIYGEL
jgi:hypothetical protein